MEIVLLRHGKPALAETNKISSSRYGAWVAEYDQAGIDLVVPPTRQALAAAAKSDFVVCSHLPRSLESAQALGVNRIDVSDALFREFEMPFANIKTPRFSPALWSAFYRLMWLVGFSANAESLRQAKQRGLECVEQLLEYAKKHRQVLFVGHGALLWFICKQLLSRGWSGPTSSPRSYWDVNRYCYSER